MTTQPEALRLADALDALVDSFGMPGRLNTERNAADELRRLHAESLEAEALREKMSDILRRTANALKGEPDELTLHSWHDLPEVAIELATIRAAIRKLHAAKGRYHTQLAACDLFDLVGLPNERPKK